MTICKNQIFVEIMQKLIRIILGKGMETVRKITLYDHE